MSLFNVYPDMLDEEESEPEHVMLENIYQSDMALVDYQYEPFKKHSLSYKDYDFLFFANIQKFEKNNYFFNYLKKKKNLKFRYKK